VVRDRFPIWQGKGHKQVPVPPHLRRSNTLENRNIFLVPYPCPDLPNQLSETKKDRRRFEAVTDATESPGLRTN
jgi:hypothetical protein